MNVIDEDVKLSEPLQQATLCLEQAKEGYSLALAAEAIPHLKAAGVPADIIEAVRAEVQRGGRLKYGNIRSLAARIRSWALAQKPAAASSQRVRAAEVEIPELEKACSAMTAAVFAQDSRAAKRAVVLFENLPVPRGLIYDLRRCAGGLGPFDWRGIRSACFAIRQAMGQDPVDIMARPGV